MSPSPRELKMKLPRQPPRWNKEVSGLSALTLDVTDIELQSKQRSRGGPLLAQSHARRRPTHV
jgi:hypothetical protein